MCVAHPAADIVFYVELVVKVIALGFLFNGVHTDTHTHTHTHTKYTYKHADALAYTQNIHISTQI
jgi:hypothetical protein